MNKKDTKKYTNEGLALTVANWNTNMLKVYYNRDNKRVFKMLKFEDKCEDF